jgi:hypothetical protein
VPPNLPGTDVQVHQLEVRTRVPVEARYPCYVRALFYALASLYRRAVREEGREGGREGGRE